MAVLIRTGAINSPAFLSEILGRLSCFAFIFVTNMDEQKFTSFSDTNSFFVTDDCKTLADATTNY